MLNKNIPFLTITTFIFLYVSFILAYSTTEANTLVLDVEGNPLEPGIPYYIRTEVSKVGIGGGIVPASKPGHPQCPQFVAQLALGWYRESPVKFYPTNPSQKHIHVSSNINVIFNTTSSVCPQGAWHLKPDATNGYMYLSSTDESDANSSASDQTTASLLKIENDKFVNGFYQLEYCPTTKNDIVCGVIDALPDFTEGLNLVWLGLSTEQRPNFFFLLSFLKA